MTQSTSIMDWGALGRPGRGDGDQIIYYRRPRKGENAGWITYGDSLSGSKLRDFVRRGFEPLMNMPVINDPRRDASAFGTKSSAAEQGWTPERYVWEPILTHPDGPAQFPVDQILAFRWYRPENCPVPDVEFPQLVGVKVKEYLCPERCGRYYVDVDGVGGTRLLAAHLRISHDWDRTSIMTYGDRIGVDFNKVDVNDAPVQDYQVKAAAEYTCEQCGEVFSGGFAKARWAKHTKNHPKVEVEAIG